MRRIGITGRSGFIGGHLECAARAAGYEIIPFEDGFFKDEEKLLDFVGQCDVLVHLAAASRMENEDELYTVNMGLVTKIISTMEAVGVRPHVMFSSSIHETRDSAYGRAKRDGRQLFEEWAQRNGASFTGFVFPNVYGPGAKVFYCSFIANFCYQLQHNQEPQIQIDAPVKLIYVENLCKFVLSYAQSNGIKTVQVPWDFERKVSDVLGILRNFKLGFVPQVNSSDFPLYATYLSYRDNA